MRRLRLVPLLLLAAPSVLPAAPLQPSWGEHGELTGLRQGGQLVASGGNLVLASPGWKSSPTQTAAPVQKQVTGERTVFTGTLGAATFTQTVTTTGGRVTVTFVVQATADQDVGALVWRCYLPCERAAGLKYVLAGEEVTTVAPFPATLPEAYVLAAGAAQWAGWAGETTGLRLTPSGSVGNTQFQDDRKFGSPLFELQVYAAAPARLTAGQQVTFGFTLEPFDAAGLAAAQQQARKGQVHLTMAEKLAIRSVTADRTEVPRYGKLELTVDLAATYDNPFDPAQIDLTARFRSPAGRTLSVPGFLYRPFRREKAGANERITAAGPPSWRVRFAPPEVGDWSYQVVAKDRSGTVDGPSGTFRCTPSAGRGYVRVSRDDPRYFAFDDGTPFFALGANVCWPHAGGTYDYDEWFPRYAAAGGNYARIWMGPFDGHVVLERRAFPGREDTGFGRYDLQNAWRLDYLFELSERRGLHLMLCLESFNSLRSKQPHNYWHNEAYNQANGGPCAKPEEFFTNATARQAFRNRLRYLLARYGWSTNLMAWEYWNEVDIVDTYHSAEVAAWHQEMSRYLRELDPWRHLQTTSYARSEGDPAVDGLPEMDYVQTHNYGARDIAASLAGWAAKKRPFGKPHYAGEFGLSAGGSDSQSEVISLHNGLWSTLASGDAGTGMLWWWDSFIHPRDQYWQFAAVSAFAKGIDWPRAKFVPADDLRVAWLKPPAQPEREDFALTPTAASWSESPANQPNTLVIPREGKVVGLDRLSHVLHGTQNHPKLHNPVTFQVDYAQPGRFEVNISGVSGYGGAGLVIRLDGREVVAKDFPDPAANTKHDTLQQYNGAYGVSVPAGQHTVVVENPGRDWCYVDYVLTGYRTVSEPRLRAWGLRGDRQLVAWVQHVDHTWSRLARGVKPQAISGTRLEFPGLTGRWQVELWDTYQGVKTATRDVTADGTLRLDLPAIDTDLAVKAVRR